MTRLLVFSDIHGAVPAVEAMVRAQRGRFDAVVVAGDIGPAPTAFFEALKPLEAPVLYVYGNWDCHLPYEHRFHDRFIHLHGAAIRVGDLHLVGFSGCPTQWGQNPHWLALFEAVKKRHRKTLEQIEGSLYPRLKEPAVRSYWEDVSAAWKDTLIRNRRETLARIDEAPCGLDRVVLVTHEKLFRLPDEVPGLGAHVFGHRHGFGHTKHRGMTLVNVSALDPLVAFGARYGVLEWTRGRGFSVSARSLPRSDRLRRNCHKFKSTYRSTTEVGPLHRPVIRPLDPLGRELRRPVVVLPLTVRVRTSVS